MKYCLLVYDPTVTLLSTNIFIDSTHLKILSVRNGEISEISVLDEQNLYYWLCECPAATIIRQQVFGNYKGSLEWLATSPGDVVAYAKKTLVNLDA